MMNFPYRFVLASNSPRRRELLAGLGISYEVRVLGGIDESYPDNLPVEQVPVFISRKKAEAYAATMADDELVITADTIVTIDGKILGKPADRAEAVEMLRLLSGRRHMVVTGVTFTTATRSHSFYDVTDVWFAGLTDEEIDYYVDNFKPYDKAGAYGIQEWIGYVGVERIDGSYFNVMGLPVQRLYSELTSFLSKGE